MVDVRGTRIVSMFEDELLGGDLLLVGVAMAICLDFGVKATTMSQLARLTWPQRGEDVGRRRVIQTFKDDMRVYRRPPVPWEKPCGAPMIRRSGPCGKASSLYGHLQDWSTGEWSLHMACGRHREWWYAEREANAAARPDLVPLPMANHGGLLVPHFPTVNWRAFWRRLDPRWVEHPEHTPWSRPTLQLLVGDGEGGDGTPSLTSL
jgi:hypothetical protein